MRRPGSVSPVAIRGRMKQLLGRSDGTPEGFLCNAPSASLYLDQRGDVRACCQNAGFPLGNVTERSLREIWDGERAHRLREAVSLGDLSLGCNFCSWQVEDGDESAVFARTFDHLDPEELHPQWPQQLELSMSNACNLQCVMCNGEWSSAIRLHREHLPPLPTVYDDAFFEGLEEFLPHLRVVKFLGGEPFLGAESLRVMEMLAAHGNDVTVHITTNGTQWSRRIERILEAMPAHLVVSLDGVDRRTYESIRVGSSFDAVVENVDRLLAHTRRRGTSFSLSHCLMTVNWDRFDEFLHFAEERGSNVWVNTVTDPHHLSLYHLPPSELGPIVEELERRDRAVRRGLTGRRQVVWNEQLVRLRAHLEELREHRAPAYVAKRRELGFAWIAPPSAAADALRRFEAAVASSSGWIIEVDRDDRVTEATPLTEVPSWLDAFVADHLVAGSTVPLGVFDAAAWDDGSVVSDDLFIAPAQVGTADDSDRWLRVTRLAVRRADGTLAGVRMLLDEEPAAGALEFSEADGAPDTDGGPSAAELAATVAGDATWQFSLGEQGQIASFDPGPGFPPDLDSARLVGRPAAELADLVQSEWGPPMGDPELRWTRGAVRYWVTIHRSTSGIETVVHSFAESRPGGTDVWAVAIDAKHA